MYLENTKLTKRLAVKLQLASNRFNITHLPAVISNVLTIMQLAINSSQILKLPTRRCATDVIRFNETLNKKKHTMTSNILNTFEIFLPMCYTNLFHLFTYYHLFMC